MQGIYAVCLSASQGVDGVKIRAHVLFSDDGRTTEATLAWPELGAIQAEGDSSAWLYSVLSRLLMDYDNHMVENAKVHPAASLSGTVQREA